MHVAQSGISAARDGLALLPTSFAAPLSSSSYWRLIC